MSNTISRLPNLTEREREILRAVVQHFILTANPVGSRQLARKAGFDLSPATVRNVMADLEEMGLLAHPHTSAGRVPSDLGYRLYVDGLMESRELSSHERESIEKEFEGIPKELDLVLAVTAKVLSSASNLLGIVMSPAFDTAVLRRMDLARLSDNRMLVVLTIESGPMKTIMMELDQVVNDDQIAAMSRVMNQRLSGLTLLQIRSQIQERMKNTEAAPGLVRFFVDSAETLFSLPEKEELTIGGRANVIHQPEFSDPNSMRGIIELIEDKDIIVHLIQSQAGDRQVDISIGSENVDQRAKELSVMTAGYRSATASGKLGVIGPTRMDYSRLKSLIEFTARTVGKHLK